MTFKTSIRRGRIILATLMATSSLAVLSACAVGPDFQWPLPPVSQHYDRQAEQDLATAGRLSGAQRIDARRQIDGNWWSAFRSVKLDGVMRAAIAGNLDLAAADAMISQAHEATVAAGGKLQPQVDVGAVGGRQRIDGGTRAVTTRFYSVGALASFDFDLFGGTHRLVEQRAAIAEVQQHRFDAAYLTLTGNVASQALLLASARAQIDAVQRLLADDRRNLDLVSTGHRYGSATQVDVALAANQLAQDQTLLPPLAQQRDVARHALSVLAGKGPADWTPPDFDLSDFVLPLDLPVSLPSELARNRPDILAAEAQLHAASAAIGVATADLYPHLQLTGSLGAAASGPGVGALWSIAAGLVGPVFHGGTLEANRRAAVDAYRASVASYRKTVVGSLGQVADILQAVSHDAEEYAAQERAIGAAEASLHLSREGYRAGEINALQFLDAERGYQRALLGQIRARTAQYLDTVQLSVALGGNTSGAFARSADVAAVK